MIPVFQQTFPGVEFVGSANQTESDLEMNNEII